MASHSLSPAKKCLAEQSVIVCLSILFVLFGLPCYIYRDRGRSSAYKDVVNYLHSRGIVTSTSTLYHHTRNSQCKRMNQTIRRTVQLLQARICVIIASIKRCPMFYILSGRFCALQKTDKHFYLTSEKIRYQVDETDRNVFESFSSAKYKLNCTDDES